MWFRSFLLLLVNQQHYLCILGAALRNPQHKKRGSASHSKSGNVEDHLRKQSQSNAPDPQCAKEAKEKYRNEAVAIEKCAETKGLQGKLAVALKSDDHRGAFDACEDVLMNCVGLSMACAKQQIPDMLSRARRKKENGQLVKSEHSGQKEKDSRALTHATTQFSSQRGDPRKVRNSASQQYSKQQSENLSRQGAGKQNALHKSQIQDGAIELCHHNNMRVVLDVQANSRRLVFGENAWEKLIQTAVNCKGAPAPTCMAASKSSCDLEATRCPCEFDMPNLPPLDHEYQYIAKEVLQKNEAALEGTFDSIRNRGEAAASGEMRMALVGLGGGMIPQYLISHSSQLSIDAIELNSDVVAAARAFFGVTKAESSGRLHILEGDGRARLNEAPASRYGIVVVDCFGDGRIPASCRSQAFAQAAYRAMQPGAEMLQNVLVSRPDNSSLDEEVHKDLEELLAAYRKVFGRDAVELQSKWAHGNGVVRAQKGR
eukprot:gnl/MRDRNA2_/MRDRNA2_99388_c0_seq1.p1 gnl/MRDRNA2_/MRDRNA2_99388_c0~~gnl/MRDRNA2_/MRDRNA2_99388_c0_seq1.p1  ORF type:complete len:486 (+),score=104.94 gnl/MRDRNA2_/MRDRNA2_99388_c0_seq1:90-1547(+)